MQHVIFDSSQSLAKSLAKGNQLYNSDHQLVVFQDGVFTRLFCMDAIQNKAFLDKRELPGTSESSLYDESSKRPLFANIYSLTGWNIV